MLNEPSCSKQTTRGHYGYGISKPDWQRSVFIRKLNPSQGSAFLGLLRKYFFLFSVEKDNFPQIQGKNENKDLFDRLKILKH